MEPVNVYNFYSIVNGIILILATFNYLAILYEKQENLVYEIHSFLSYCIEFRKSKQNNQLSGYAFYCIVVMNRRIVFGSYI